VQIIEIEITTTIKTPGFSNRECFTLYDNANRGYCLMFNFGASSRVDEHYITGIYLEGIKYEDKKNCEDKKSE